MRAIIDDMNYMSQYVQSDTLSKRFQSVKIKV